MPNYVDEIKESLQKYLTEKYENITIFFANEEKVVLRDNKISLKFLLLWEEIIDENLHEWFEEHHEDLQDDPDLVWGDLFRFESSFNSNNDLIVFKDKGFFKNGYCEFLFQYYQSEIEGISKFYIGEINVTIGTPSDYYKLVFKHFEGDDSFDDWNSFMTISLNNGITKDNFKSCLQQAIFLLGVNNPSYYAEDYPYIYQFYGEEGNTDSFHDYKEQLEFTQSKEPKYPEVIDFYNSGVEIASSELSFLYFYKVLEYFFVINRKNQIGDFVSKHKQNLDLLIKELTKIYKEDELNSLKYLLRNNVLLPKIQSLITEAYSENLISKETSDEFAEQIYSFRNSIVHGKMDTGFDLKTPDILNHFREATWYRLIRNLALIVIVEFCFEGDIKA